MVGNQPQGLRSGHPNSYIGKNPNELKKQYARSYIHAGTRVLEIGCGTGTLTRMMAQRGAIVTSIDASPRMLAEAEKNVKVANLEEHVSLKYMDAALIGDRFPAASFDLIVSTLVFSELPPGDQRFVLETCQELLAPNRPTFDRRRSDTCQIIRAYFLLSGAFTAGSADLADHAHNYQRPAQFRCVADPDWIQR